MRDAARAEPFDPEPLLAAVRLNWKLWTIFQADISSADSPLPLEVRQNMLSLANFVDKTSVDIIANPEAAKVEILITINRELAMGLFETPPGATGAPTSSGSGEGGKPPAAGSIDASV